MFIIPAKDRQWEIAEPQVMGIINATSDSFYKDSRIAGIDAAIAKAAIMVAQGASILDIGGQSTRPGAIELSSAQELENVLPIIKALHGVYPNLLLSVDTYNSLVAKAALDAGAHIINDISCGAFDKDMLNVVGAYQAGYIGMHSTGSPSSLHEIPTRANLMDSLYSFFEAKKIQFEAAGIHQWMMDPGFGFGKTIQENFKLVQHLSAFKSLGLPILLGVSRKSTIYKTLQITPEEALNGTTVLNTVGLINGASVLRVHDVLEAMQAIQLVGQLQ
jgi:dihydropteroate synthase